MVTSPIGEPAGYRLVDYVVCLSGECGTFSSVFSGAAVAQFLQSSRGCCVDLLVLAPESLVASARGEGPVEVADYVRCAMDAGVAPEGFINCYVYVVPALGRYRTYGRQPRRGSISRCIREGEVWVEIGSCGSGNGEERLVDSYIVSSYIAIVKELLSRDYGLVVTDLTHGVNFMPVAMTEVVKAAAAASVVARGRAPEVVALNSEPVPPDRGGAVGQALNHEVRVLNVSPLIDVPRTTEAALE